MRGALLEPGTAPPVRYSRLLIRYLGCNRLGLDFSSAWLASAFDLVLGRYWHSGADLPSYNVVESQSPECSRPVRAPGNGSAFIVASGVRCGLDAPPGPGLAPVMTLTQFPQSRPSRRSAAPSASVCQIADRSITKRGSRHANAQKGTRPRVGIGRLPSAPPLFNMVSVITGDTPVDADSIHSTDISPALARTIEAGS